MIEKLSQRLADAFVAGGAVKPEDRDVYVYGLDVLLSTAFSVLCMLAVGVCIGRALQAVVFLLFFCALRSVAGGYHADTHWGCFLVMLVSFGLSMAALALLPAGAPLFLAPAAALCSDAAVLALAPVPHENRPVSAREAVRFRGLSLSLAALETLASAVCLALGAGAVAAAGSLGMLAAAGSLCAVSVKRVRNSGRSERG